MPHSCPTRRSSDLLAPRGAEDLVGSVAYGVVDPGDRGDRAGEVEVAGGAVGVGPGAVAALRVDPPGGGLRGGVGVGAGARSEEHRSELQSLMRISYAVFCLKKKTPNPSIHT